MFPVPHKGHLQLNPGGISAWQVPGEVWSAQGWAGCGTLDWGQSEDGSQLGFGDLGGFFQPHPGILGVCTSLERH